MARTVAVVALLAAGATSAAAQGAGASAGSAPGAITTDDLLARLVTEQVEPGVLRIVNDGHRDLSRPVVGDEDDVDASAFRSNLAAGEDGSVWIFGPDEFFRLGEPGSYATDEATPAFLGRHVEVTPDGLVWALDEQAGTLRAFGEGAWAVRAEGVTDFDVAPDGTVWASGPAGLRRGGAAGWTTVGKDPVWTLRYEDDPPGRFWVSPIVHDFITEGYDPGTEVEMLVWCDRCRLELQLIPPYGSIPALGDLPDPRLADMGDAGDYWALTELRVPLAGEEFADAGVSSRQIDYLVHVEGGPMTVYTNDEGVPAMGHGGHVPGFLRAAPDGSVWLTPGGGPDPSPCSGLARFDGDTWSRYLAGTCIYALDVAPDGTAWAQGGTAWAQGGTAWAQGGTGHGLAPGPVETYAIRPS
jgi:hypothetical protein